MSNSKDVKKTSRKSLKLIDGDSNSLKLSKRKSLVKRNSLSHASNALIESPGTINPILNQKEEIKDETKDESIDIALGTIKDTFVLVREDSVIIRTSLQEDATQNQKRRASVVAFDPLLQQNADQNAKESNEKENFIFIYNCPNPDPNWEKMDPKEVLASLKDRGFHHGAMKINIGEIKQKFCSSDLTTEEGKIDKERFCELYEAVNLRHPRKIIRPDINQPSTGKLNEIEEVPLCEPVDMFPCKYTGMTKVSKLQSVGAATVIYFKMLKSLIICFLVVSILNLPLIFFYSKNNSDKKIASYTDVLFKTTIGNIGSTVYNCQKIKIEDTSNPPTSAYLEEEVFCGENMKFSQIIAMGKSSDEKMDMENSAKCSMFRSENDLELGTECDVDNIKIDEKNNKISFKCPELKKGDKIFFVYSCYKDDIALFFGLPDIPRKIFCYIVIGIDILSALVIFITLRAIDKSKEDEFHIFNQGNYFIKDYTLTIKNVPLKQGEINTEINDLIGHFQKLVTSTTVMPDWNEYPPSNDLPPQFKNFHDYFSEGSIKPNCIIFDVNYPILTSSKGKLVKEYRNKKQKIEENTEKIKDLQRNVSENDEKATETAVNKLNTEITNFKEEIKKIKEKLNNSSELNEVNDIYVTFRSPKIAKTIKTAYKKTKCQRCCMIFCCDGDKIKPFYYKDKWLDIHTTRDEPSNIKWENITYSSCLKLLRYILSLLCAIIILLLTLYVMCIFKEYENNVKKEYNTDVDCGYLSAQEDFLDKAKEEYQNKEMDTREKVNVYCYCYNQFTVKNFFKNTLSSVKFEGVEGYPCEDFGTQFVKFKAISLALIMIIPILNTAMTIVLQLLTSFEKNKTLSEDMSSNMSKIFTIQFINAGLFLVLVNMQVDEIRKKIEKFPFFAGKYIDITPGWCENVGVVILFSTIIGVATPHLSSLGFALFSYLRRCCDGGGCYGTSTSKENKKDYYDLYTGPVFGMETRYASILSTFWVCMFYGAPMPILNVIFFVYIFLTFVVDKFLILRYYRKPPVIDLKTASTFINYSFVALAIHLAFSIWTYGNPKLLLDTGEGNDKIQKNVSGKANFGDNILIRLTLKSNYAPLAAFLLMVIYLLFKFIILDYIYCKRTNKTHNETEGTVENVSQPKEEAKGDVAIHVHGQINADPASENQRINKEQNQVNKLDTAREGEIIQAKSSENKLIEIGLALSFPTLAKIYTIKKVEYFKLLYANRPGENILIGNLRNSLLYLRQFMIYKIVSSGKVTGDKNVWMEHLINKFDELIMNKKMNITGKMRSDEGLLSGDTSYNLAFNLEFEYVAYYELLKNL
ncbi:MAG: hypothetical protein MJ252_12520 [archaeon]|nr:hypothetical protein [archaeon]